MYPPIRFACPTCATEFEIDPTVPATTVRCLACGQIICLPDRSNPLPAKIPEDTRPVKITVRAPWSSEDRGGECSVILAFAAFLLWYLYCVFIR